MTIITIFVSSLCLTTILVTLKAVEIKYKKRNFIFNLLEHTDDWAEKVISGLKFKLLQLVQIVRYIVLVETKEICKNLLEKIEEKIANEYRAKQLIIMGRKNIPINNSASFYLKKIHEEKQNMEKGKIEESL